MSSLARKRENGAIDRRGRGRVWASWFFGAWVLLLAGCGTQVGQQGPSRAVVAVEHILVTLPPAPPALLDQHTRELAEAYGLQPIKAWTLESLGQRCVVFASSGRNFASLVRSLAADPRVDLAQPIQHFETLEQADPGSSASASYRRLQYAADRLHLEQAHRLAQGRGIRIAVIDSGIDINHPELTQQIELVRDFAAQRLGEPPGGGFTGDIHGTAVAGIIAAADNGAGILGVAPAARLLALKACWPEKPGSRAARCDSYTLALALDFAIENRAQIVNLSLGGPRDPLLEALVRVALERKLIVVGAAGSQPFPAAVPGVLAIRSFSPTGELATLSAPGDEILSTVPGGSFDFFTGSSVAAAHVSGIAALVLEHRPQLGSAELQGLLSRNTHSNPGHQLVDACLPLAELLGQKAACP